MFRIEGIEEETKGVVQKLNHRKNFPTQTGVRFRVLETAEGNCTLDAAKRQIVFKKSMVYWDV
jgi:hypothetical protein